MGVANAVHHMALKPEHSISLYPGTGTVDGVLGDHVLLAPAYKMTREDMKTIAELTKAVVEEAFKEVCARCSEGTCR